MVRRCRRDGWVEPGGWAFDEADPAFWGAADGDPALTADEGLPLAGAAFGPPVRGLPDIAFVPNDPGLKLQELPPPALPIPEPPVDALVAVGAVALALNAARRMRPAPFFTRPDRA